MSKKLQHNRPAQSAGQSRSGSECISARRSWRIHAPIASARGTWHHQLMVKVTSCGRNCGTNKPEPGSAHDRRHIMTSPGHTGTSRRDIQTSAPTASDQLTCIATVFGHQSEINVITFCMQKMISDDDYNGWTCSHMSNMHFLPQDVAFSIQPVLPGAALRRNCRCCQAPPCGETGSQSNMPGYTRVVRMGTSLPWIVVWFIRMLHQH